MLVKRSPPLSYYADAGEQVRAPPGLELSASSSLAAMAMGLLVPAPVPDIYVRLWKNCLRPASRVVLRLADRLHRDRTAKLTAACRPPCVPRFRTAEASLPHAVHRVFLWCASIFLAAEMPARAQHARYSAARPLNFVRMRRLRLQVPAFGTQAPTWARAAAAIQCHTLPVSDSSRQASGHLGLEICV